MTIVCRLKKIHTAFFKITISCQLKCDKSLEELNTLYEDFYKDHPFTHVTKEPVFLKQVVNTNKCVIQLEKVGIHAD